MKPVMSANSCSVTPRVARRVGSSSSFSAMSSQRQTASVAKALKIVIALNSASSCEPMMNTTDLALKFPCLGLSAKTPAGLGQGYNVTQVWLTWQIKSGATEWNNTNLSIILDLLRHVKYQNLVLTSFGMWHRDENASIIVVRYF